ncbi:MAG: Flp family type IVb pilin, partial [Rhodospirillaceae bacterium]
MGRLFSDTRGAAKIEYTLLVGLISVGVVATVAAVGETTKSIFTDVADAFPGRPQAGSAPGGQPSGGSSPGGSSPGGSSQGGSSSGGSSPGGSSS